MSDALDAIDTIATQAFEGNVVRKDLVRRFKGQYPIPTYVAEFLLGRYCASVDEEEIAEGLKIVERQLSEKTVRAGEHELFKARAKEKGHVKLIDIITARLDTDTDSFLATLPSLQLKDVRISPEMVHANERMLTGGFYAEIELAYDPTIAQEKNGRPFGIDSLREIQLSKRDVLPALYLGREAFATEEWKDFLIRSIGLEPEKLTPRAHDVMLLRMIPFVERNYNMVELGPRGTGKSHLFQQVSPYAHLLSGGKATVARMFVNMATGQRGLVCQYDVICFDEIAGVSFDSKDGVNIMKGFMASGEFSRGKDSIRAEGGIVFVGNLDMDLDQAQRVGHLLAPLPPDMRDDTAFMDRLHAYAPGWEFPKLDPRRHLTDHFGLVSDFLSECFTRLRTTSRAGVMDGRIHFGGALSGRDIEAVRKTVSGLVKLLHPNPGTTVPDADVEWIVRLALEARRRVKEQQRRVFKSEFRNTHFSYTLGLEGVETFVATPELRSDQAIETDPLPPGQVWAISPGSAQNGAGLYRIEVSHQPGSGMRILNQPAPPAFRESVKVGEQVLFAQARSLVGDRDPRAQEFTLQLRAIDVDKSGAGLGVPVLTALCGSLLGRNSRGGTIVVGSASLGGSIEMVANPVQLAELAIEKQAQTLLMPVSARRQLNDLPDELWTKISIEFYKDGADAVFKALVE